ncbi:MAG: hypothetical protein R3F59_35780 [Myxococcota bacterium]
MADIQVKAGTVAGGRIDHLRVGFDGLPDRTVDRDTVLKWMADGHSLIPLVAGRRLTALQRVEVDDHHVIRTDNQPVDEDQLPAIPAG